VKLNISLSVFQLAKLGIDIILISRTKTKLEAVAAEIGMNGTKYVQAHVALFNPLNAELNPICYLLALLGAHHFLHVSRIRVKSLTLRLLMSYIYIYIWSTYS